jgi:hypothetical protein
VRKEHEQNEAKNDNNDLEFHLDEEAIRKFREIL